MAVSRIEPNRIKPDQTKSIWLFAWHGQIWLFCRTVRININIYYIYYISIIHIYIVSLLQHVAISTYINETVQQHSIACSQLLIVNNSKRTTWNNTKGPESAKLHLMHAVSQYSFPTQCIDSFYLSTHIWPLQAWSLPLLGLLGQNPEECHLPGRFFELTQGRKSPDVLSGIDPKKLDFPSSDFSYKMAAPRLKRSTDPTWRLSTV